MAKTRLSRARPSNVRSATIEFLEALCRCAGYQGWDFRIFDRGSRSRLDRGAFSVTVHVRVSFEQPPRWTIARRVVERILRAPTSTYLILLRSDRAGYILGWETARRLLRGPRQRRGCRITTARLAGKGPFARVDEVWERVRPELEPRRDAFHLRVPGCLRQ